MNISYDYYKIFYHVALLGNITSAAEKLYISQPAVSQSIKQLEKSLNCTLFTRTSKGVELSSEGKLLFQYVRNGIEQIQLGESRLQSQLAFESGEIIIGASDMTLHYYLLPYLEEFHLQYPNIRISITNGPTPDTIQKLKNNEIDFGVISDPFHDIQPHFDVIPVKEIQDIFIGGSKYANQRNISLETLAALPLVMLEQGTSSRTYIDEFLGQHNLTILPEFELATSDLIVQFAKRNLGIGCVVKDFATEELDNKNIFEIQLNQEIPKRNICIIKKNNIVSKASEKLLQLLFHK